ncbi:MAG: DUF1800 domain-containing protein, partial [Bacteroidota bacterium]
KGKSINATIDWSVYVKNFENTSREELAATISSVLIQTKSEVNAGLIKQYADDSSRENFIKTATIQIMSTPEYQMC